ncbi:MAG: hypothetical protein ACPGUV_12785, partial [Polyangiales bacterium]
MTVALLACGTADLSIPDGSGGVGDACRQNEDCRAGLACIDRVCQPAGDVAAGMPCELTASCQAGLYCGPTRTCIPAGDAGEGGGCQSTSDCQQGLVCVLEGVSISLGPEAFCRAAGQGDIDAACAGDLDCLAGLSCASAAAGGQSCQSVPGAIPGLPQWTGESCVADTGPARAYFDLPRGDGDFYRLPFPNDARRGGDGRLDLSGHPSPGTALPGDPVGRYLTALGSELTGFSQVPTVLFRFSTSYDFASANSQGGPTRVQLIDITQGSSEYGRRFGVDLLGFPDGTSSRYICPNWLGVTPSGRVPLRPATTYAVVLEQGITQDAAAGGGSFAVSADLQALLSDTTPTDGVQAAAHAAYAPLRAYLADGAVNQGLTTAEVLNAAVFTTQDAEAPVVALRQVIDALAPGEFSVSELISCDGAPASPCADGSGQRSCSITDAGDALVELHGKVRLPIFQEGTPPYIDAGGGIVVGGGSVTVQRYEPVCF